MEDKVSIDLLQSENPILFHFAITNTSMVMFPI